MDDVTRRWTLRLVAALAAGSAVLGGCSEPQEASDTLPPATAAPSTTEGLPPLGPPDLPMPDAARTQDAAGAEAFVRYYIDLINRTSTVMDAAPLREFSNGCADCDRIAANTESSAGANRDYEGGEITITALTAPLITDKRAEMAIRVNQAPLVVVGADGSVLSEEGSPAYTGIPGTAAATWDPTQATWTMATLAFG
ncbi:DUF6318 family protein [Geodermatophilus sabuli]|uniref:DUF6318 family protein n=1 Tax=Geodermatophilus sabuli TaxID=1564158 RepID=UPI0013CF7AA0